MGGKCVRTQRKTKDQLGTGPFGTSRGEIELIGEGEGAHFRSRLYTKGGHGAEIAHKTGISGVIRESLRSRCFLAILRGCVDNVHQPLRLAW
eukprot:1332338-Prymnesium_polylepis.1